MIYLNNGKGIVRRTDSIQLMDGNHFSFWNPDLEGPSPTPEGNFFVDDEGKFFEDSEGKNFVEG